MGVDLMTYRSRIASFRGGIDVISVTVGVQFTKALKCLVTLLTVITNLTCVLYQTIEQQGGLSITDEQNASFMVIKSADILLCCTGCIAITGGQKYIGAVAFIQLLLLAAGIESNPGPMTEALGFLKGACDMFTKFGILPTSYCENIPQTFNGGTCSYLLGNKGVHTMNGNPATNKDHVTVTITSDTDKVHSQSKDSVAFISLFEVERNEHTPYQDAATTLIGCGTGFRVGDRYLMSAYHVFRDTIENMLDIIVRNRRDDIYGDEIFYIMANRLEIDTERETFSLFDDLHQLLKMYLVKTATDIEKLLEVIRRLVDPDIKRYLNDYLKNHCAVDFKTHGRFTVDWKIKFGDEDSDIIIVALNKIRATQEWPKALMLDQGFRQHDDSYIVRYIDDGEAEPRVAIDLNTKIYTDYSDLRADVEEAEEWWEDHCTTDEQKKFNRGYSELKEERNDRVFLRASSSFTNGSSGSPVVYLLNESGLPFVSMVYQRGHPNFYYDDQKFWDEKFIEDTNPIHQKCFIEESTTLKKVSELLDNFDKVSLKADIFGSQCANPVKGHCSMVYSLEDPRLMGYSSAVKQFWRNGLNLFKEIVLSFMSGLENKDQDIDTSTTIDPALSEIS